MKIREKQEARRLRGEGKSVKEIARIVGVSTASVSVWVKDVFITEEQKEVLRLRSGAGGQEAASFENKRKTMEKRKGWQLEGREMYREGDKRYSFACALFWGEGFKNRNMAGLCNADERLMIFWVKFLRDFFQVSDEEFTVSLSCYLNNGLTLDEIQNHWLDVLDLPVSSLRKTTLKSKYYTGKDSGKHPFGICTVRVNRTDIVQKLFGSVKEAISDNSDDWLN